MSLRRYDPNLLYLVTMVTIDRRWSLATEDAEFQAELVGALATAQRNTGARVYAFTFMSNHYHGLFAADFPEQMQAFLQQLHAGTSRLVNRRYQRRGPMWHPRADVLPVLPGDHSELEAMRYILGQAPKAGAACHPLRWSGASSTASLLGVAPLVGRRFDQTAWTLASRNGKDPGIAADYTTELAVELTPLPCLAHLAVAERQQLFREMADAEATRYGHGLGASENVHHCEEGPVADLQPRESANSDERQSAWDRLRRSPEPARKPRRLCIAPTAEAELEYGAALDEFYAAYSAARLALRAAMALAAQGHPAELASFPPFGFPPRMQAVPAWRTQALGSAS